MSHQLMCCAQSLSWSDSLPPHGLQPTRLLCPWRFSRQECWSGLPCPPPGALPNPGIEPRSPALQVDFLPSEPPGSVVQIFSILNNFLYQFAVSIIERGVLISSTITMDFSFSSSKLVISSYFRFMYFVLVIFSLVLN